MKDTSIIGMREDLNTPFTQEEIKIVMSQLKSTNTPSLDGLPTLFYHFFWPIFGRDITLTILNILNNNGSQKSLITLIFILFLRRKTLQSLRSTSLYSYAMLF